ncbi:hypothetical protein [Sphingomonas sp. LHG3406-1]|uniref:hypothetical protein n=1 Tax=Sphingomonas sp. LHG3406-1 TaxID=2804617 RepID=UPI0026040D58|nr:hypothetical protein [Sphingomonas sp. LHG3406-1]
MNVPDLPAYTDAVRKAALLRAGGSGTIYSLVMPESEAALEGLFDGDREGLLDLYREAWTQKQDQMHEAYLEGWRDWSKPLVTHDPAAFPFAYPTAGASEGIFKLMSEYAANCRAAGRVPSVHLFDGEYEGFPAFAASLSLPIVRHDRSRWQEAVDAVPPHAQFWLSQPSAIDGAVWPQFEAFVAALADARPEVELIPDLTYVGSVARDFRVSLDAPNIPAFVFSHSKPFGGYYHRVGGVFARDERPSLFGNRWFKNLLSLAWGTAMMRAHDCQALPRRYRSIQEEAARRCGEALGVRLEAADVMLLGTAPASADQPALAQSLWRGSPAERVVRLCLTPTMAGLVDAAR